MTARTFHIQGIDHVELFVPDRSQAARWYSEKFGFEVIELAGSDWGRPGGPVMISTDGGQTKLALKHSSFLTIKVLWSKGRTSKTTIAYIHCIVATLTAIDLSFSPMTTN